MHIVLPSIVSGIGVILLLVGIFVDQAAVRFAGITLGALLLWLDFFITMAIFRYHVRAINTRLGRLEQDHSDR
jgi:hypothetical protein